MLTTRITHPLPPQTNQDSVDIFSSSLSALFTDDTQNSHGTPGSYITYTSPRFGDLRLHIPAHPDFEEGRKLFAHYLWNAGVVVAEGVERASQDGPSDWDPRYWDVRTKKVLELGAGTALPSLISALCGAGIIIITDHPLSPALSASTPHAIAMNVGDNLFPPGSAPRTTAEISVRGYVWGETCMYSADKYGTPIASPEKYDRIIIADCLWLASQHANLVKTVCHFLDDSKDGSCAIVVAGFHTGRSTVQDFFEFATEATTSDEIFDAKLEDNAHGDPKGGDDAKHVKGSLKAVETCEMDVDGNRRAWMPVRQGENREEAKRWCVVAVLTKK